MSITLVFQFDIDSSNQHTNGVLKMRATLCGVRKILFRNGKLLRCIVLPVVHKLLHKYNNQIEQLFFAMVPILVCYLTQTRPRTSRNVTITRNSTFRRNISLFILDIYFIHKIVCIVFG